MASKNIPDTQFGFYPGRNTLQPISIYGTSSMLHEHSSQVYLAASTLRSLITNNHTTPSLDRNSGNTCSTHACWLLFCPLFKTCMTLMTTFWKMERMLECAQTQVWSRAALCPLCVPLCILMMPPRLLLSKPLYSFRLSQVLACNVESDVLVQLRFLLGNSLFSLGCVGVWLWRTSHCNGLAAFILANS